MEEIDRKAATAQSLGAGGGTTWSNLQRMEGVWEGIRTMKTGEAAGPAPQFVTDIPTPRGGDPEYDVIMCGGTLGIFAACALQAKGARVALVEQGELRGRTQEWNISRKEMEEFIEYGVLTAEELEACITSEFNPIRAGFDKGKDIWVRDILNLGVQPTKLVELVRARFEEAGGRVIERTGVSGVSAHPDMVVAGLKGGPGGGEPESPEVTARLLIDCMGFASPIVRQARWGTKPDGICLVVGCLGRGFEDNTHGDLIYTNTPLHPTLPMQYFWEAFPAGSGPKDRTSYMFTYIDADESRPTFEQLLEDYWDLMPDYQGVELDNIEVLRVLYGFFPTYRDSPLPAQHDRIVQIGDASGIQSPLSFGGFGAIARHMERIVGGVTEALEADALDKAALSKLNPYQPNLSSSWLFQKAMSVPPEKVGGKRPKDEDVINSLMVTNFMVMEGLGPPVLRPFLQDVVQFKPLGQAMLGMMVADPLSIPPLLLRLGPGPVANWFGHYFMTGMYTAAHLAAAAVPGGPKKLTAKLPPKAKFEVNRALDAVKFGSGMDYEL